MKRIDIIIGLFKYGIFAFIGIINIVTHIQSGNEHMFTRGVIAITAFIILMKLEEISCNKNLEDVDRLKSDLKQSYKVIVENFQYMPVYLVDKAKSWLKENP